jgi:N utilization substance protein B
MSDSSNIGSTSRHRAREVALQALFAMDMQNRPARPARLEPLGGDGEPGHGFESEAEVESSGPAPLRAGDNIFDGIADHFEMPEAAKKFARELVVQICERRESLDAVVSSHAKNWRVSRMAVVDRNILRLAAYELIHTTTPAAVILDEAVELAQRFGADASPPFVNGVLDAVAKEVRMEETG